MPSLRRLACERNEHAGGSGERKPRIHLRRDKLVLQASQVRCLYQRCLRQWLKQTGATAFPNMLPQLSNHDVPSTHDRAPADRGIQEDAGAVDPVCGMTVNPANAKYCAVHNGETYSFCSAGCQAKFEAEPDKYLTAPSSASKPPPKASSTPARCTRRSGGPNPATVPSAA
jgi:YHS domain-containing protein